MEKVEEISESESIKLNYGKPAWPDALESKKGGFEKILDSVNVAGSLVETYPGVYRIEKMVFEPRDKCHIVGQEISGKRINMSLPFNAAMEYIKESGFPYQKV